MMMYGNKMEYIQAYTEVNCLLKYFPKEYIKKLPNKLINMIQSKSDKKYNIIIDTNKDLKSQNISPKTKDILAVLKYNYWADETEKEHLKKKFCENERKFQEELSKKYSTDNLFKNKEPQVKQEQVSMIEYKESFFSKVIKIIKKIFKGDDK